MKINQLHNVLEAAEQMYRRGGNASAAQALSELSSLFVGYETKTVSTFAGLIAKVAAADNARD